LIENAITYATMKHSEEGPLVMVNVYEENGKGIIEVVDNGTGISDDMLDRIGEYLKQKKRQYSKQNTVGMGLALVYDTVQQHGGELGITSHYGEGTRITVNIPLA
jgi:signal transduction histidine kinase